VRAAKGDAFYMVSGDEAAYEKARPYLEAAAGKIILTGALGNAAKLKLALNVLTNLSFNASLEAMQLATAMGLPQELFEEGGQANTMLNALHLQYLSPTKCQRNFANRRISSLLAGSHEIAQKDLGWLADGPRPRDRTPDHLVAQLLRRCTGHDADLRERRSRHRRIDAGTPSTTFQIPDIPSAATLLHE
jgi:hypothetical protein